MAMPCAQAPVQPQGVEGEGEGESIGRYRLYVSLSIIGTITCVEKLLYLGLSSSTVTGSNTALAGPGW